MQEIDVRQQVGTAERLPLLDILGRPRREGHSTRHVGDGRVVAIPPGISRAVEEQAIAALMARLSGPKGLSSPEREGLSSPEREGLSSPEREEGGKHDQEE